MAEAERALSQRDRTIEDQRRRLRRANKLIEARDRQLAKLGGETGKHRREASSLMRWAEELDSGIHAILGSRRWKIGNLIGNLSQGVLSGSREPSAVDSIRETSGRFRIWKKDLSLQQPEHASGGAEGREKVRSDGPVSTPASPGADEQERRKPGPERHDGIKKVQVGCGPHNLMEDWWNVDIRGFKGIDAVMDATKPWPYKELDYVFGEHFLEHLTLDEAIEFIRHAGNSLKPGGILRLSTPNLEWVLLTHYNVGEVEPAKIVSDTLKTNRAFHGWGHKFLYTSGMLSYVLTEMDFQEVSFFSYGQSNTPELKNLERHGNFSVHEGHPSVIVVEARKGVQPVSPSPSLTSLVDDDYRPYVRPGAH